MNGARPVFGGDWIRYSEIYWCDNRQFCGKVYIGRHYISDTGRCTLKWIKILTTFYANHPSTRDYFQRTSNKNTHIGQIETALEGKQFPTVKIQYKNRRAVEKWSTISIEMGI